MLGWVLLLQLFVFVVSMVAVPPCMFLRNKSAKIFPAFRCTTNHRTQAYSVIHNCKSECQRSRHACHSDGLSGNSSSSGCSNVNIECYASICFSFLGHGKSDNCPVDHAAAAATAESAKSAASIGQSSTAYGRTGEVSTDARQCPTANS